MNRTRVLVALSGGVDSSVAALLLKEQGHDLVGVFLRNGVEAPAGNCRPKQGCCSAEDSRDASRVADRLGIPYHAVDMAAEFESVQAHFAAEYARGRTPNPCAVCNRDIKFGALLDLADAVGAEFVATGHYARIEHAPEGPQLWRGADPRKDQSYVMFPVGPAALARTLLPVGGIEKTRTRAIAEAAGLPVFGKPDSQEICFVPTGDYRDMLNARGGLGRSGKLVHVDGRVLGEHAGHMGFTRGQRRGLGIASIEPLYVVEVDPDSGDVLIGPRAATFSGEARVEEFATFGCMLAAGERWDGVEIQFRSAPGGQAGALQCVEPGVVQVCFADPAASVAPGQGLAVYRGARLLGGGWIAATDRLKDVDPRLATLEV
ncbi:MAG TPA: tRNA 2-thiouridine(34) synthase MnmA [Planctomycetota bacterium]